MAGLMMPSGQQVVNQIQPGMPQQQAPQGGPMGPQMPPQGQPAPQGPAMDPETMARVRAMQAQGMSEEEIGAMMGLYSTRSQSADAQRQRALAKELRGDAAAQFQGRDTGKFYVGPTWVNMLGSIAQQRRAAQEDAGAALTEKEIERLRRENARNMAKE